MLRYRSVRCGVKRVLAGETKFYAAPVGRGGGEGNRGEDHHGLTAP
jgi:hypothetical protein